MGCLQIQSQKLFHLCVCLSSLIAEQQLPYNPLNAERLVRATNAEGAAILRNLPYARRGFVFKTASIQAYYEGMPWYLRNPTYVADKADLTPVEAAWLQNVMANQGN